jgi:glycosyltransferase involved in cell wall biosynthesis
LANRTLNIPFVTTVHGFNSVNAYSRVMTRGDRVICVSGAIRDFVIRHYAVDAARLRVIPRGVDLVRFDPARIGQPFRQRFVEEFGLSERVVISTVGRVTQLKDLETFIRAVGLVRVQQPAVLGLIVGGVREDKRDYYAGLQNLVSELGLESHIRFTGSQSEVADIYALSQVVVSSSKKPESFGRSAAEALAMGTPVVATGHGGMLDIVVAGETGFLFEPGDAEGLARHILAALARPWPGLREFVVNRFSLQQMVGKTLAVYGELGYLADL